MKKIKDKRLLTFEVTKQEEKLLKQKASKLGMSLSAYLRFVGVNAEVRVYVEGREGKKDEAL